MQYRMVEKTHNRRNSSHHYFIQTHLFILIRVPSQQLIKLFDKRIEQDLRTKLFPSRRSQQPNRIPLLLFDFTNNNHHLLQPLHLALLVLHRRSYTLLLVRQVCSSFRDTFAFSGEGGEGGGKSRVEKGEIVSEFRKTSRVGGASAKSGERGERLRGELC